MPRKREFALSFDSRGWVEPNSEYDLGAQDAHFYRDLLPGNGVAQFGEFIEKALKKKWRLIERHFNRLWTLSGIRYRPIDAIAHGRSSSASTTTSNDG